jgi:hypothetical protein
VDDEMMASMVTKSDWVLSPSAASVVNALVVCGPGRK